MTNDKLNLMQKINEIKKAVPFLQKEKGEKVSWSYVGSGKILAAVKDKMEEHGVLHIPDVTKWEVRDHKNKDGGHQYFTLIDVVWKWINIDEPEDFFEVHSLGQGLDSGERGIGKALTYSEKYSITKTLSIPTDKDDPDGIPDQKDIKKMSPEMQTYYDNLQAITGMKPLLDEPEYREIIKACGAPKSNKLPRNTMQAAHDWVKKVADRNVRFRKYIDDALEHVPAIAIDAVLKHYGVEPEEVNAVLNKAKQLEIFEGIKQVINQQQGEGSDESVQSPEVHQPEGQEDEKAGK